MKLMLIVAAASVLFFVPAAYQADLVTQKIQEWLNLTEIITVKSLFQDLRDYSHTNIDIFKDRYLQANNLIEEYKNDAGETPKYQLEINWFSIMNHQNKEDILFGLNLTKCTDCSADQGQEWDVSPDLKKEFYLNDKCYSHISSYFMNARSTWAFSAVDAVAYSYCINNNAQYVALDVYWVIDCSAPFPNTSYMVTNRFKKKGWHGAAMTAIHNIGGLMPNLVREHPCPAKNDPRFVAKITEYKGRIRNSKIAGVLESVVSGNNLISVAMAALDDFFFYKSGIFDNGEDCREMPVNHVVSIVGYGIDNESGVKFWKVLNYWNNGWNNGFQTWGENGHFRILRGGNACNIETYAYTIKAEPNKM